VARSPKEAIVRIINRFTAIAGLALFGLSQQASASVLYDNGPMQGYPSSIYSVYSAADSFTLSQASIVTGVNFGVWTIPGDTFFTVDFGITNAPYTYADNGTASVTLVPTSTNPYAPNGATSGSTASFSTGSIALSAGTYYLVLSNAVTAFDFVIYWDANHGPSFGYQCTNGGSVNVHCGDLSYGSNSFQIIGYAATPLPSTWLMLLSGFLGLGIFAYRGTKKNAVATA
jgi:hypothetical protein